MSETRIYYHHAVIHVYKTDGMKKAVDYATKLAKDKGVKLLPSFAKSEILRLSAIADKERERNKKNDD